MIQLDYKHNCIGNRQSASVHCAVSCVSSSCWCETFATLQTFDSFLTTVYKHVLFQVAFRYGCIFAFVATIWSFTTMNTIMNSKLTRLCTSIFTMVTTIRLHSIVSQLVSGDLTSFNTGVSAVIAIKWLFSTVHQKVPLHAASLSACIIAKGAFVGFVFSVTTHVNLETAACNTTIIANITFVWALPCVC